MAALSIVAFVGKLERNTSCNITRISEPIPAGSAWRQCFAGCGVSERIFIKTTSLTVEITRGFCLAAVLRRPRGSFNPANGLNI
jgi:hypothetical protein